MEETHEFFTVREEDIDGNAHMNNAAYVAYFDAAARGVFQGDEFFRSNLGVRPFLREASYVYRVPLWFGEIVKIDSTFQNNSPEILFNQEMTCSGEVVARAKLEYGLVRASLGEPQDHPKCARVFEDWRRDFVENYGLGASALRTRGFGLFVRRARYNYFSPIRIENAAMEYSWNVKGVWVLSEQKMLNREEVLARSNVDYVFVDLQTGHHIIPSEELIEKLKV